MEAADLELEPDLGPVIGANLRRERERAGMSLNQLAARCGVSRAMIGQIEHGTSVPTVTIVSRLALGLGINVGILLSTRARRGVQVLRATAPPPLPFSSRALTPLHDQRLVELYELRLLVGHAVTHRRCPPGTRKNLVVHAGAIEVDVDGDLLPLQAGDAVRFQADVPHGYRNVGEALAVMYLVTQR